MPSAHEEGFVERENNVFIQGGGVVFHALDLRALAEVGQRSS